ncbi:hypothetical protein acdb102_22460 [Acidothermaceae bacterium B102]|nr:hypothetical protein acdb102_22460 [Acidothermaceae bacterium B102]
MAVTVVLEPSALEIAPGQHTTVAVTIGNASELVEHYGVELLGLPEGLQVTASPLTCKLHPGEAGRITLTVTADTAHPPPAGRVVVGVHVQSPYREEEQRCEELPLTVLPAPALELSVRPTVASGWPARAHVSVINRGNTLLDVDLGASDPEAAVRTVFAQPQQRLAPGAMATIEVRMYVRRPLSGHEVRRQVTLSARAGEALAETPVTLVHRPYVPAGAARLAGAVSAVTVLAAAVVAAAVIGAKLIGRTPSPKPTLGAGAGTTSSGQTTGPAGPVTSAVTTAAVTTTAQTSGSPSPTTSVSGSPGGATSGATGSSNGAVVQPPAGPTTVDLSKPPAGKAAVDQILTGGAYFRLSFQAEPDTTRSACATSTAVSWLLLPAVGAEKAVSGVVPGYAAAASGATASATPPQLEGMCNDLKLDIQLPSPSQQVVVHLIARTTSGASQPTDTYVAGFVGEANPPARTVPDGTAVTIPISEVGGKPFQNITVSGLPANADISVVLVKLDITPAS